MADEADVSAALVLLIAAALYPATTAQPSALGGVARVFRGYPAAGQLEADLAAGVCTVLVNPRDGSEVVHTTMQQPWAAATTIPAATFALGCAPTGQTITVTGTGGAGQAAVAVINRVTYAAPVVASDTAASIAAQLAGVITATGPAAATVAGAVVTIPWARSIACSASVQAAMVRSIRQQTKGWIIDVMAPSVTIRDAAAALVDQALSAGPRILLADGTAALLRFTGGATFPHQERERLFRRSLTWAVEFQTTQTAQGQTIAGLAANTAIAWSAALSGQIGIVPP